MGFKPYGYIFVPDIFIYTCILQEVLILMVDFLLHVEITQTKSLFSLLWEGQYLGSFQGTALIKLLKLLIV